MKRALLLLAIAACEAPAPVTPILSVLKRTPTCFALMSPAQPPADALALTDTCDADAIPPVAFAGTDLLEVIVDYGDQVDFDTTTVVPVPVVAVTVDGEPVDVAFDLVAHRVRARAFFIATFRAPARSSANVRISASVEPGFAAASPTVFSTVPAPVSLAVAECDPGVTCDLVAAVGRVRATVGIPADLVVPVTIHQTLDGAPLPDATAQTAVVNGRSVATLAIDVPAGSPDAAVATWRLDAQVGDGHAAPIAIALARPAIAAQLSCGAHCTVAKGAVVGLEIDAPPAIHPQRALLTSRLGGVPQLVDLPIDLVNGVGLASLTAPATGVGAWTIDVTVAGYAAPTIEAAVQ